MTFAEIKTAMEGFTELIEVFIDMMRSFIDSMKNDPLAGIDAAAKAAKKDSDTSTK